MESSLDLSKFWCWQKDCTDYGKKGAGNIVLKERYGKDNRALLKCRTCGHCFSETHGTPFFGLNTTIDEVCRTLAMIPEKGSIRGAARMSGHDKGTICKWVDLAGKHCKEVTDYFSHEKHSKIKNGGLSPRFLNFFHFISCFGNYLNHGLQAHLINSRGRPINFGLP